MWFPSFAADSAPALPRMHGRTGRGSSHASHRSNRPLLEVLEGRTLLAVWTVTDIADDPNDAGSLRFAVDNAQSGDEINFGTNVTGTIALSGRALAISRNVDIEGPVQAS